MDAEEVGVAPRWQGKGIAKRLLPLMFDHGRKLGCTEAWVLSDRAIPVCELCGRH
ncbi:GNAT family N-acetyltransferase [Blastomonas sp.]|uniref:GNAT family N-acetyltransferase n=1 Tax=Blastomonas sp. TaxID=1909299 RepID=UPI0035940B26